MARFIRKRRSNGRRTRRVSRRAKPSRGFARKVKRAVNTFAEKKAINTPLLGSVEGSNGVFWFFNDQITEGGGSGQRVGNKIHVRSLKLKGWIQGVVGETSPNVQWRMIIGCWHDYPQSTPTYAQIFDDPPYILQSFYNRDILQAKAWVPMYDKIVNLTAEGSFSPEKNIHMFELGFAGKRLPHKDMQYNTSDKPNSAYFIWLGNTSTEGIPYPRYQINARMTYTDV